MLSLGGRYPSFGDPDANAAADGATMDKAISDLQSAYASGQAVVDQNASSISSDILGAIGIGSASSEDSIKDNYAQIQTYITQLDGDLRQAVLNGQNQAGDPYTIQQWLAQAAVINSDIKAQTGYSADASGWTVLSETVKATAAEVTNPFKWPWWLWAIAATGGLIVLSPVIKLTAAAIGHRKHEIV